MLLCLSDFVTTFLVDVISFHPISFYFIRGRQANRLQIRHPQRRIRGNRVQFGGE